MWLEKKQFSQFDRIIIQSAETYSLEPALIKAVIWKESKFDTFATGSAGEIGLMQLTDAAAFEWADASKITTFEPEHLYHPSTNTLHQPNARAARDARAVASAQTPLGPRAVPPCFLDRAFLVLVIATGKVMSVVHCIFQRAAPSKANGVCDWTHIPGQACCLLALCPSVVCPSRRFHRARHATKSVCSPASLLPRPSPNGGRQ